jgi:hypothetical protein
MERNMNKCRECKEHNKKGLCIEKRDGKFGFLMIIDEFQA